MGKGHDTFAPMGPWIVPKEFYGNPMEILRQTLSVGGVYGSSIITLYPGDVINNGTSGGVGMGTAVRGEQRFLQPGEVISATRRDRDTHHAGGGGGGAPGAQRRTTPPGAELPSRRTLIREAGGPAPQARLLRPGSPGGTPGAPRH